MSLDSFFDKPFFSCLTANQKAIFLAQANSESNYNPSFDFPLFYRDNQRLSNYGDYLPYYIAKLLPSNLKDVQLQYPEMELVLDKVAYCDLNWLRDSFNALTNEDDISKGIFTWYIRKIVKSNVKPHFFGKKSEMYRLETKYFSTVSEMYVSFCTVMERYRQVWEEKRNYIPYRKGFDQLIFMFPFCDVSNSGYIDMIAGSDFIGRIYFISLDNNLFVQAIHERQLQFSQKHAKHLLVYNPKDLRFHL
jgi:hypothetical protein